MCRLLLINSKNNFDIAENLNKFAEIAKNSEEFQGDGWGMGYDRGNGLEYFHSLRPIWEDDLDQFGTSKFIMVHARSAFMDNVKPIEHNMPFYDDKYCFIFNGELRGVKIKVDGRIGAEKIFNFIKQFDKKGLGEAIKKGNKIIEKRTDYIRAMNYIVSDSENIYINCQYSEDKEYFTMYKKEIENSFFVCSERFPGEENWAPIGNKSLIRRSIL